ncbi:alpha/beta fold hydrolase [Hamadaea tsunoensis]|uniref:alpha/beta fold hydrolase n=1 Tax=Hamadaea tsunoensis TaxID=53368 RepID=UPI0004159AF6|nr:alpha/beta fold hydrolase [Hamadaea tsunoensis]
MAPDLHRYAVRLRTGVTVSAVAQGDRFGVPVVLLHAWGESARSFDRLLPLLPPAWHVVAMDQRGHGAADKPPAGYALADLAEDVEAFLEALNLPPAVLVGSSSGGYVAQLVAVRSPERVRGLVLAGTPRSLRGRAPFADELDRLTDPVDPAWVRACLDWFPRYQKVPDWYVEDRVEDGAVMPAEVWRASLAGLSEAVPPTETGPITAPALILRGDRDEVLPAADHEKLAAAIPGARLVAYADTGHLVLWEQPGQMAADLAGFVAELP